MDKGTDQGLFQQVIEQCKEPIMITDIEGNIIFVNTAWCKTYGYTQDGVIGQTPAILHSGQHDERFYKKMWASILDPEIQSWQGRLINKTKSGRHVPVHLTITHFYDQRGQSLGYMGIAMDLSHFSRLERRIDNRNQALEKTLSSLKDDLEKGYQALAQHDQASSGLSADPNLRSHLDSLKKGLLELDRHIQNLT